VVVAPGTAQEEKMCVTLSGATLTVVDPAVASTSASANGRGVDDTTARSAIAGGAVVYPVFTATDADEANELTSTYSAQGHIVYQGASTFAGLGIGTAGQALKVNSGATAPEWGQISAAGLADGGVEFAKLAAAVQALLVPAGTVSSFAGANAPTGWLLCHGQAVSKSTYAALYSVLGPNAFGTDTASDFYLPDLRGRVVAGQDDMGGTSANRLTGQTGGVNGDVFGATGGAETHTLTEAQMPSHTHTQASHYHNLLMGGSIGNAGAGRELYGDWNAGGSTTANIVPSPKTDAAAWSNPSYTTTVTPIINATGGGGAHNNVQPTIILNYIIKT
jgi:microcystin-dependent protein